MFISTFFVKKKHFQHPDRANLAAALAAYKDMEAAADSTVSQMISTEHSGSLPSARSNRNSVSATKLSRVRKKRMDRAR